MQKKPEEDKGKCALCLNVARLTKSHIISDFLYAPVYDENHSFLIISSDASKRRTTAHTGIYELLLCADCEKRLGVWESYSSEVYREIVAGIPKDGHDFSIHVDYTKFKLFAISLLWRAGESERAEFKDVTLGKHHGERLRKMLITGEPGQPHKYGFLIAFVPDPKAQELFGRAMVPPQHWRNGAHHTYRFLFGATLWEFVVSSHTQTINQAIFSLHVDGALHIRNGGEAIMEYLHSSTDFSKANVSRSTRRPPRRPR